MINNKKDKSEERLDTYTNILQEGAATETIQRYGKAAIEHIVAYSGKDNETGRVLKQGLKKISQRRVNPNYQKQNIQQQGGFSAETKYVARQNADSIINGSKTRVFRTDDVQGRVNDPLADHIVQTGKKISEEQMKFVGKTPKECLNKLTSSKFQKYLDADIKLTVPADYYEEILVEADKSINRLGKQLEKANRENNVELIEKLQKRIDKYKKIKVNLKDSGITTQEARFARLHPLLSTTKDIARVSHEAGMEQAKYGAVIGGSISLIKNLVAVVKGEKKTDEAALDLAKDTGMGSVTGYVIAFTGSTIKGIMQNSENTVIRTASKTNLPGVVVTTAVETGKTLKKYISGKISGIECLEELGEKGTGQLSSAMFAVAGQIALPIPVIGGMVGAIIGYTLSTACYKDLTNALKEAKLSGKERLQIEAACKETINMINQYRKEMNLQVREYISHYEQLFDEAFEQMDKALLADDIDGFINGANSITGRSGKQPLFDDYKEFKTMMEKEDTIKI